MLLFFIDGFIHIEPKNVFFVAHFKSILFALENNG